MINVNLLPPGLRPVRRSPLPYIVVGIAAGAVLVILLSVWMTTTVQLDNKRVKLEESKAELERVRESALEVKELEAKQASIAAKRKAIEQITSDRLVWSRQLYYLAKLMPDQVWLKDIQVETKTRRKEVPVPDAKEGEPKTKLVPVPYQSLKLCGYALSYQEEMGVNLVGVLVCAIENAPQFSEHFIEPEPRLVEDEEFGGVNVKEFEVNCEIVARNSGSAKQ